jgi:hypothetical protein
MYAGERVNALTGRIDEYRCRLFSSDYHLSADPPLNVRFGARELSPCRTAAASPQRTTIPQSLQLRAEALA